jgi:hypothetical protein
VASSVYLFPGNLTFAGTITFTGGVTINSSSGLTFLNGTTLTDPSGSGKLLVAGTTPMLQLGGTTTSFPAWKRSSNNFYARDAADVGYVSVVADEFQAITKFTLASMLLHTQAPTISSGFGSSPSISASNGAAAFVVNVGTGGSATNGVVSMPTAATGWVAICIDLTAAAGHTGLRTVQTASATNSITIESQNSAGAATAWATGSLVRVIALAY